MDGVQEIPGGLIRPFVQKLVDTLGARSAKPFALALPDGSVYRSGSGTPAFTLRFNAETALLATLTRGHIGLLESYFDQPLDVEGDLGAAFAVGLMAGFDPRLNPVDKVAQPGTSCVFATAASRRPRPMRASTTAWAPTSTGCGSTTR